MNLHFDHWDICFNSMIELMIFDVLMS